MTSGLVLLAEDDVIIANELDATLQEAGFAVAGPFASCAQAEAWLKLAQPSAAILDHQLKDGPCDGLLRELTRRGVPTIIFSGHSGPSELPPDLSATTWITKPAPSSALVEELRRCIKY